MTARLGQIKDAIMHELLRRQQMIEQSDDISSIGFEVKLNTRHIEKPLIRAVLVSVEHASHITRRP